MKTTFAPSFFHGSLELLQLLLGERAKVDFGGLFVVGASRTVRPVAKSAMSFSMISRPITILYTCIIYWPSSNIMSRQDKISKCREIIDGKNLCQKLPFFGTVFAKNAFSSG